MQKVKLMLSRLKNDRLMLVLTSALFTVTLGYIITKSVLCYRANSSPLSYLSATLDMSMIAFVFFMFLSYEYLCKIKQHSLEEVLKATKKGYSSFYITGILILASLLAVYALIVLGINIVIYFCLGIDKTEYLAHIVLNIFLNVFLILLIGILLGAAVSFVKQRIAAYVVMFIAVFLSTPMFTAITDAIYEGTGKNITLLRGIFDIFPPSLGYSPIYSFGYSILPYRWDISFFWIFLFWAVLAVCLSNTKRIKSDVIALVCVAIATLSMVGYFLPASKPILRRSVDSSGIDDMNYYSLATQKNNASEFKIEKYILSLRIDRQLSCEATLDLNRDNLSIYSFTLYHGFKVKSICSSSGKALRFNQDGDYISVYREEEPLNRITIKYSGCAPRFFSNSQGTSLPGWFPYYPHAGEKELYDCSMYGFNRIFCSEGTEFEISILDKNKVFCSLDKKDEKYVGKSNGVTIVSGFYDSLVCENIQVVYPYLDTTEFLPESIKKQISEYVKNGIIKKTSKKVMVIANLNMASIYERYCSFSDHTTVSQLLGLSTVYEGQMFPSYKLALRNAFDYYESDKANWNSLINLLNEAYAGDKELLENDARTILQKVIDEMGSAYVESKVKEYLYDDNDTRHWKSFIEELRGENND